MNLHLPLKHRLLLGMGMMLFLFAFAQTTHAQQAYATIELVTSTSQVAEGSEFEVSVVLNNPSQQNVISVRSWLEYDPQVLEGVSIDTQDSPFALSAPGENEFSRADGLVKIGRSNISGGFSDAQATVATVRFKVLDATAGRATISAYNYQTTELGHTSVNIIDQGFPVNILGVKPDAAMVTLGAGQVTLPDTDSDMAILARPQHVKINTGSGYVDLKWDLGTEAELEGYYIYYGKNLGLYTRRRAVGALNEYRLDGLNNGESYYFALTAYDADGNESDYSDEVAIIINEPLSSTAPFEDMTDLMLASVPEQPVNGTPVWWLSFMALGTAAMLMFRRRAPMTHSQFNNLSVEFARAKEMDDQ